MHTTPDRPSFLSRYSDALLLYFSAVLILKALYQLPVVCAWPPLALRSAASQLAEAEAGDLAALAEAALGALKASWVRATTNAAAAVAAGLTP